VQVKTVWKRRDFRVKVSLPAIERLSKSENPGFLIGFQAEDIGGEPLFDGGRLIHMRGDSLARVLEVLRDASTEGSKMTAARRTVSFDMAAGTSFRTGRELLAAMRAAVGDERAYGQGKAMELQSLGYDNHPHRLDVAFRVNDADHLHDALLGLRAVELESVEVTDMRFGRPAKASTVWTGIGDRRLVAHFLATPKGDCSIVVHPSDGGQPIGFDGGSRTLPIPKLEKTQRRVIFSTELFELDASANGRVALRVGQPIIGDRPLPVSDWRKLFALVRMLGRGSTKFVVRDRQSDARFEVDLSQAGDEAAATRAKQCEALLDRIDELWGLAGIRVPSVSEHELIAAGSSIDDLHCFWSGGLLPPSGFNDGGEFENAPQKLTIVRVLTADLGGSRLAAAESLSMVADGVAGSSTNYVERDRKSIRLEEIATSQDALVQFADRIRLELNANGIMFINQTPQTD